MISVAQAQQRLSQLLAVQGITGDIRPLSPEAAPQQAQLFCGSDRLYKVYAADAQDRAAAQASRQSEVAASGLAPAILFHQDGVLAMPLLSGPDLAQDVQQISEETLRATGHWLRRFHDLSARKFPFRPAGHVNWLNRLMAEVDSGARALPDTAAFHDAAKRTQSYADDARKQKATRAVTHRDMTLSNLVWHDGQIMGIDFENRREDEPLRDLFTLVLDLGCAGVDATPLRDAYGDRHTAPEVRLFLQRCFCQWVWANTSPQPSRRQALRLAVARDWLSSDRLIL